MTNGNERTLKFRCPKELEGLLPRPAPAALGVPEWVKAMPSTAFSSLNQQDDQTVKRCPPFLDAMTCGFLIPLICDLRIQNGEITWDSDLPSCIGLDFPRSPVSFHDSSQLSGSPLFDADRFFIKFHNLWMIEAPQGCRLLFTHPLNRFDLPFITLSGVVDSDRYKDAWIHFPAHWHDTSFEGVLPKGTPIAQCIPLKREDWAMETLSLNDEEARRTRELSATLKREPGLYRRKFRA